MKKIYTRIFLLVLFASISIQMPAIAGHRSGKQIDIQNASGLRVATPAPQIHATAFYSEDFSAGLPATWTAVDNAGHGVNWKYTATGIFHLGSPAGLDTLSTVGTSAANGYMMYDSDSSGGGVGGENADLTSGVIDCSSHTSVILTFNQLLVHYAESAKVYVSNDGSNWTEVYDASAGLSQGQATPNPDFVNLDISSVAAGQDTVYIRWNFTGDYDYWWMIDDVQLYEPDPNDAGVIAISQPVSSCTVLSNAETVTVEIFNFGSASIDSFDVSYVLDGGTAVTELITDTILPGSSHTYSFTATADLSVPGNHTIAAYTSVSGDSISNNDTTAASLYNGPHEITGTTPYTMGFEANEDLSGWNYEDANNDGNFWSIATTLAHTGSECARMSTPNASVGADDWLFSTCLNMYDTASYDLQFYYRTFSTATQANMEVWLNTAPNSGAAIQSLVPTTLVTSLAYLPSLTNFTVPSSGTYYIAFHVTNADSTTSLRIDDINISLANGSSIQEDNTGSLSVYPNPGNGLFYVNSASGTNFVLSVSNSLGQIIRQEQVQILKNHVLDLSGQPAGIYQVRILNNAGQSVKNLIITR